MSREIKFRAWIEETKTMERGLFGLRSDGKASFNKDCVLMQFTGLKDKNGVDVYEGDVVIKKEEDWSVTDEWAQDDPRWTQKGIVLPLKETNRDFVTLENFGYWLRKEEFGYEGENLQRSEDYEVIGNIYENPELINQ